MVSIRKLIRDRRGAAAMVFVLTLPVMLAGMALAIDYASFRLTYSRMQIAADAAALAAIGDLALDDTTKVNKALALINANLPDEFGDVTRASDVTLGTYTKQGVFTPATGAAVNAARVVAERSVARDNAVNRIFSMFISNEDLVVRTVSIAARPGNVAYEPPQITVLDSTAWDFNELYAYCYNPDTKVRGDLKLIANNNRTRKAQDGTTTAGGDNTGFAPNADPTKNIQNPSTENWPKCEEKGSSVSFYLRNYRGANQDQKKIWSAAPIEHYSDTVLENGVEKSALFSADLTKIRFNLVETIMCDTKALCNPSETGNLVNTQEGVKKDPANVETRPCSPGKYMYYGWEDRPPSGSSDRDYNDITIVLRCPSAGQLGGGKPRLVG